MRKPAVQTNEYERVNNRKPTGKGAWEFMIVTGDTELFFRWDGWYATGTDKAERVAWRLGAGTKVILLP